MFAGTYLCLMVGISGPDTLTARYGESGQYEQDKVRLQGIDTSERKQPFRAMTNFIRGGDAAAQRQTGTSGRSTQTGLLLHRLRVSDS